MNNQATLDRLRDLKLTGMFQAFEALLQLSIHQQPPADELLVQLTDAEHEYRQQRKTQWGRPRGDHSGRSLRYAASLEELHYGDGRNLDKTAILRLADANGKQAQLTLLQIMEDRHGKSATHITSQLPVNKWYEYIGEPTLADAILDRITHKAHRLDLKGESMRRKQRVIRVIIDK